MEGMPNTGGLRLSSKGGVNNGGRPPADKGPDGPAYVERRSEPSILSGENFDSQMSHMSQDGGVEGKSISSVLFPPVSIG